MVEFTYAFELMFSNAFELLYSNAFTSMKTATVAIRNSEISLFNVFNRSFIVVIVVQL